MCDLCVQKKVFDLATTIVHLPGCFDHHTGRKNSKKRRTGWKGKKTGREIGQDGRLDRKGKWTERENGEERTVRKEERKEKTEITGEERKGERR